VDERAIEATTLAFTFRHIRPFLLSSNYYATQPERLSLWEPVMNAVLEKKSRFQVLGTGVSITNMSDTLATLEKWVTAGAKQYVCVTTVHGVMESYHDPQLREIHNNSGLTVPDGMPLVWAGKIYGNQQVGRVYGPDLMLEVCRISVKRNFTHFLYGGNVGVAEKLKDNLEKRFPGIAIVGTFTPPFRPLSAQEQEDLKRQVAGCRPDFFWVGLSTPKQERFIYHYLPQLETRVMLGVGAAFDIHAGRFNDAPDWIKTSGMQWFYRLCLEPRRLWRRYLIHNSVFVRKILKQLLTDLIKGKVGA
jgi:N-acetylglucosaminyldiphosphoundecaprenol N-acetyl-beta-D-mannosaminyltransferase